MLSLSIFLQNFDQVVVLVLAKYTNVLLSSAGAPRFCIGFYLTSLITTSIINPLRYL